MTPEVAVDIFREALSLTALVVAAIIVPSLLVGLLVAMFQAATQTLSFLPRLMVSFMTLIVLGPWLVGQWMEFTTRLIHNIPFVIG